MRDAKISLLDVPKARLYVAFVAICVTVSAFSTAPDVWRLYRISQAPVAAAGVVTALDCPNHGHVDYTFDADGATRRGRSHYVEGADCRRLRVGDALNVSYERGAPDNNYAFAPTNQSDDRARAAFRSGAGGLAVFVLLGPLFLVFVVRLFARVAARLSGA